MRLAQNRIVLRDWCLEDVEAYGRWLAPGHAWQRLDGPYYPRPTPDEVAKNLDRLRARISAANWPTPRVKLPIVAAHSDRLLGHVSRYWQSRETHWLSLGVGIFDPEDWGRGLGFEALGAWTDYLFTTMPELARLDLRTWSGNPGMMRLAEKLGFEEEARFRKARIVDGVYFDGMGYGILREEWADLWPRGFQAP